MEKLAIPTDEKLVPLAQSEKEYMRKVLATTNWHIIGPKGVAKILKLHLLTMKSKLKKLNITKSQN